MAELDKIYEAFGELIYSVAKADGKIQNEEKYLYSSNKHILIL